MKKSHFSITITWYSKMARPFPEVKTFHKFQRNTLLSHAKKRRGCTSTQQRTIHNEYRKKQAFSMRNFPKNRFRIFNMAPE